MTARFWRWLAPIVMVLTVLLAPSAWADTYTDELVAQFGPAQHVVADPAATPPLQHADDLNQQIVATHDPIYVAAVAANQTGVTTPEAVHGALLRRLGKFGGVIVVIDSRGYHVRAYNVPAVIANSVDSLMRQSAAEHRNDPYGATSAFVTKLAAVRASPGAAGPAAPATQPATKSHSWNWLWVLGGIGAIALLVWFFVVRIGRQRQRQTVRDQIEQDLISVEPDVNDLAEAVVVATTEVDVSAESNKASLSLSSAREAFHAGNYSAAAAHINNVRTAVHAANIKLHPLDVAAVQSVPENERKQGSVRVNNPNTGQPVVINNNDYRTAPSPGYGNYYGGGMYNGMYFYPGWYPYPFFNWFWSPLDIILVDALLMDHWHGNYGYTAPELTSLNSSDTSFDQSSQGWNQDNNWSGSSWDSQQGNVGFDGSSLGGGWDSGGVDSSASNVDFGGSWDFGGGGFDSGSSGGGNSGF
ncbi:MAG: hypothetical protein K2Q25_03935 [Mycobacteriaceae bacterium]|nr:hypothetical protein [Mycobacteriaceae bacterium]